MSGAEELSLPEASAVLGLHYMTVYRYVRTGRLPARRQAGGWLVRRTDVETLALKPRLVQRGRRGRPRHGDRVARLVTTLLAGDEAGAWSIIEDAVASGATVPAVDIDLIGAAMREVGEHWAFGRATVADEHRASVIALRLIGRAGAHVSRRGRHRGTIVLGAPAGEIHSLPSALLADVLRAQGFEVHDLGADVPTLDFVAFVAGLPAVWAVGVGVTMAPATAHLAPLLEALRERIPAPIVVGGAGVFTDDLLLPPGVVVSRSSADAVALLAAGGTSGS